VKIMGERLIITGVEAHRVYQRNVDGTADIAFTVQLPAGATGRLEARTGAGAWTSIASAEQVQEREEQQQDQQGEIGKTVPAILEAVTTGEHSLLVRLVSEPDGEVVGEASFGPLFVGDLWIMAGQSNMEGCGKLIRVEEPQKGVSCFYMNDTWNLAEDPLNWAHESPDPIHWMHLPQGMESTEEERQFHIAERRRERVQGAGLGIPFGKMVLQHTGVPIGLIMVAHGGTSMDQWDPELKGEGGRSLYGSMLRSVQAAGGKVKGCLWYQGESDALEGYSDLYYDKMLKWVASLREDLGDPQLPFIYAQISVVTSWSSELCWNQVQDDQLRLEGALSNAAMVPTIDAVLADTIHPDSDSLRDIGNRMAWEALRMVYGKEPVNKGPRFESAAWNAERTELTLQLSGVNGKLNSVERAFAFQLTNGEERLPLFGHIDPQSSTVLLKLEAPAPGGVQLWHGRGLNPVVNVRDGLGIPLPVFGPVEV